MNEVEKILSEQVFKDFDMETLDPSLLNLLKKKLEEMIPIQKQTNELQKKLEELNCIIVFLIKELKGE